MTRSSLVGRPRSRVLPPLLNLGFALTGAGVVLTGCVLPRLSAAWHLRDKDAGLLLLVQFTASALGALLVRKNFRLILSCGYAFIALSLFAVVFFEQHMSLAAFALYGLGLGMAMTSTSMLTARLYPDRKGAALAILNFSWSVGALSCPLLVARFLPTAGSSIAFAPIAILAVPFALLPLLIPAQESVGIPALPVPSAAMAETKIIFYFASLGFLYVGIESSVGNWLSTYATRAVAWNFSHSTIAVSCFWASLLLGRALTPALLTVFSEARLYRISMLILPLGIALILMAHGAAILLAGAALTGLALAPLFPLILSFFLGVVGESSNAGWVFAVAGLGGAALSWLTGAISSATHSLRVGLMVPVVAALLMLVITRLPRPTSQSEPA